VTHDDPTIDAAMAYDAFGRLVVSSNNAAAYRYARDDRGLITNELAVIGGITNVIVRDFDDYGRPSRLRIADSDYDQTYVYDDKGRLSVIGIPGSTVTYAYTPDSLDAGYSVLTSSNAVLTRALYRDPQRRGLILSVSNLVNGVDSGSSFDYTYDALGRPVTRNLDEFGYNVRGEVAWARYGTNTLADIYDYDFIGNFTSNRLHGAWSEFEANELNVYATIANDDAQSLAYDLDGNLLTNGVWSYIYDSQNRLLSVTSNNRTIVSETYDANSRRIITDGMANQTVFLYDDWNVIQDINIAGSTVKTSNRFWGTDISGSSQGAGGIGGLLCEQKNGGVFYPTYDNLGNIVAYFGITGSEVARYSYDVFGNDLSTNAESNPIFQYRFSTKPFTKCHYYYGYRFYAPFLERWINRDPIGENGGYNLYMTCQNRPICKVDLLGQKCCVKIWDGAPGHMALSCDNGVYISKYPNKSKSRIFSQPPAWLSFEDDIRTKGQPDWEKCFECLDNDKVSDWFNTHNSEDYYWGNASCIEAVFDAIASALPEEDAPDCSCSFWEILFGTIRTVGDRLSRGERSPLPTPFTTPDLLKGQIEDFAADCKRYECIRVNSDGDFLGTVK